jgi:tyrosine-protein kinase Etk/Wzc
MSQDHLHQLEQATFSITRLLVMLGAQKWWMLSTAILVVVASWAVARWIPKQYVATAVIMTQAPQGNSTLSALGQLSSLAGAVGPLGGMKSQDDLMVALLKSRRIQDELIKTLDLKARYDTKSSEGVRKQLGDKVTITLDKKTGLIVIDAADSESVFASRLANSHVEVLRGALSTLAINDAQLRRKFFEQQLDRTRQAFATAEATFRQAQAQSGFALAPVLAEGSVRESVAIRSQISSREIQLQALSRTLTNEHPEFQRQIAELMALRQKLSQLEHGGASQGTRGSPAALDAYRDMKVQEAVLETLVRQLEMAKLDEAREGPTVQFIDVASPPEGPSKPSGRVILIAGALLAIVLAITVGVLRVWWVEDARQPTSRLRAVTRAWVG